MDLLQLKAALSSVGLGRRKVLFGEARNEKGWRDIRSLPEFRELMLEIQGRAVRYLECPLKTLPYSLFKLFWQTGSRREYEAEYFERRDRLNIFAIMTLADGGLQYLSALEDIIWAICDEYTWCLPAHVGGNLMQIGSGQAVDQANGSLQPERPAPPEGTIDLFAAETGFALAEILSLLGTRLALPVINRSRAEVFRRVLQPYMTLNPPAWWEMARMNWAAVCAGSIGAAAIYLIESDEQLAPVLQRVLGTIDCYLEGFGQDGACVEGLSYWTYGFGFFSYFAALLKQRTGGGVDLFQNPKVKQIALFQQKCYLFGNQVASFSDASPTENYQPGLTHFLKKIYPEVELPESRFQAKLSDDPVARWAHVIRNLVWYEPSFAAGGLPAEAYYHLPDAQWFVTRKSLPGKIVCFTTKGGHNDEPHNHNDIGSFILNVNGDNLLTDPGRSQYTRQYFGTERYTFFCPSSRGHSVPIIAGEYQKPGREYSARRFDLQTLSGRDEVLIDLTDAYGKSNLRSLVRKFTLATTNAKPELIMRDEYLFKAIPVQIGERFITSFKPQRIGDGLIRIAGLQSGVDICFKPGLYKTTFAEESFTTQEGQLQTVYLIDFLITSTSPELTTEFWFRIY